MNQFACLRIVLILASCLASCALGGNVNNSLIGTPVVKCGPDTIEVSAKTQNDFDGVLFVKNWRRTDGCFQIYDKYANATREPKFFISLSNIEKCGFEIKRNPDTRAVDVFTIVVISFHLNFMTMCDHVFAVHCTFEEKQLTVAAKYNFLPDLTTRYRLDAVAAVPSVELKIVNGGVPDPQLPSADTVLVGNSLSFIWYFTQQTSIYGLIVDDCVAETLDGRKMPIISKGCTLDEVLVSNVQYFPDKEISVSDKTNSVANSNWKAFADAMAFKFPDAEDIWVICSVRLCLRSQAHLQLVDGATNTDICQTQTQNCAHNRRKRTSDITDSNEKQPQKIPQSFLNAENLILMNKLKVMDKSSESNDTSDNNNTLHSEKLLPLNEQSVNTENNESSSFLIRMISRQFCMAKETFSLGVALVTTIQLSTIFGAIIVIYFIRKATDKSSSKIQMSI